MNLEEVNDSILADLAGQHRTYFVTSLLSERLDRADLAEVLLYAYGTLAGQGEMEEFRADRPVRDHEGFCDCETSRHFWRGVFDQRGTFFLAKDGKVRKRTGSASGNLRPTFRVAGTQVLLSRLYDFFRLYSAYPQAASEHFLKQIDGEKGKVEMSGAGRADGSLRPVRWRACGRLDRPRRRDPGVEARDGLGHRRRPRMLQAEATRPVPASGRYRRTSSTRSKPWDRRRPCAVLCAARKLGQVRGFERALQARRGGLLDDEGFHALYQRVVLPHEVEERRVVLDLTASPSRPVTSTAESFG
ncbi:MAG: hypothetical protein WDO73_22730 [Ignavibacteriota bacterium]